MQTRQRAQATRRVTPQKPNRFLHHRSFKTQPTLKNWTAPGGSVTTAVGRLKALTPPPSMRPDAFKIQP